MANKRPSVSDRMSRALAAQLSEVVEEGEKVNDNSNTKVEPIVDTTIEPIEKGITEVKAEDMIKPITKGLGKEKVLEKEIDITNGKVEVEALEDEIAIEKVLEVIIESNNEKPIDNNIENTNEESLSTIVQKYITKIEDLQKEEAKPMSFTSKKEKIKFDDKLPTFSFPARVEIHEVIAVLSQKTPLKKYQIMELLLLNGLKSVNFE